MEHTLFLKERYSSSFRISPMVCLRRYLVRQVFLWDLDDVLLGSVSVALVGNLLSHQLLQDEQQQLVVVSPEGQVPCKCLKETDMHQGNSNLHVQHLSKATCIS